MIIYDNLPLEMRDKLILEYERSLSLYPKPQSLVKYFFDTYNDYFNIRFLRTKEDEDLEDMSCSNCRIKVFNKISEAVTHYKLTNFNNPGSIG